MMAQAIRRVCGTSIIPRRRAIAVVMPGRSFETSSRSFAAPSMPSSSVEAACVDGALRNAHQADHVGQVLDSALQPAGLREALCVRAALGKDAVFEAGRRQGGAQVVGVAHRGRVAQGDGGLDDAPVGFHHQPEPGPGLLLDGASGHVLGLDHHGRAAGRGDDDVGAPSGVAEDGPRVLGPHLPARHHPLQQVAQGVVDVRLRLARHAVP